MQRRDERDLVAVSAEPREHLEMGVNDVEILRTLRQLLNLDCVPGERVATALPERSWGRGMQLGRGPGACACKQRHLMSTLHELLGERVNDAFRATVVIRGHRNEERCDLGNPHVGITNVDRDMRVPYRGPQRIRAAIIE